MRWQDWINQSSLSNKEIYNQYREEFDTNEELKICINIVTFKEKEDIKDTLNKTVSLFNMKCLLDTQSETINIILLEDSLQRFNVAIKEGENHCAPRNFKIFAREVGYWWETPHSYILIFLICLMLKKNIYKILF